MKRLYWIFACSLGVMQVAGQVNPEALKIVRKMTVDEKIKMVVGKGMRMPGMNMASSPTVGLTKDRVDGAAGSTYSFEHLGVPTMVVADGPAGLRIAPLRDAEPGKTFYCTAFPVATLLASTWDTAMVYETGKAMGREVRDYGVDVLLAPALNIQRNPLGGRNFEYYSEDPFVSGMITASMVNGIESNGVGTSIKHFAANNQETNRNLVNTVVGERALREIYLRGFQIAVKRSQPWTVMSSYNLINGTYTSQSYDLLTTILRKEWGFKGMVMTDWFGGVDAVAQMKAGNDLLMPGTATQIEALTAAVKNGTLSEAVLDTNAARVLTTVWMTPTALKQPFSNSPDLKAHAQIARKAAADGMVLLKNEKQALPLSASVKTVAAFGNTSYRFISGGTGSGDVNEAYTVSLVDGLKNAQIKVQEDLQQEYEKYIAEEQAKLPPKKYFFELPPVIPEMNVSDDRIRELAAQTDIAFITIGRNAGEFQDRKKENDYELSSAEVSLIRRVAAIYHAVGKKAVVIINTGGVVDVSWNNWPDAILLTWQGGQEAGNAVADLLTGRVNPSGKLAVSFGKSYSQNPSAKNFPGRNTSDKEVKAMGGFSLGFPSEVVYEEGIYVGYRYHNTFKQPAVYPFGYGLSYTQFSYSNLRLSSKQFNGKILVQMDVKNTGSTAGREVVQLYLSAPGKSLPKPSEELKGFAKTGLLQPGATETVRFTIDADALASFDEKQTAWVAEPGTYLVKIGASSTDFKLQASFAVSKPLVIEKCYKVIVPQVTIQELKP